MGLMNDAHQTIFRPAAAVLAAVCSVGASPLPAQPADRKPNVVFIIADDLNCNLGAYGHSLARTPNIDRLAARGLLFENAYCNQPLCGPSRASFMMGLYPEQNNIKGNAIRVRERVPDAVTLPQHFMAHGYRTARVGKIYHYNNPGDIGTPGHDDPASWTETYNPRGRDKDEQDKIVSIRPGSGFGATLSWLAAEGTDEEQTDGKVATVAVDLLKKYKDASEPFFLAVGFYKPHTPYVAPRKYFAMHDPAQITVPKVPAGYFESIPKAAAESLRKKDQIDLPEEKARAAIHAYNATISFLDAQVGRVLEAIEALGLSDNTIIIFTSDHGYHMGEHGHFQKRTLFDAAGRVPLIVSYPGLKHRGQKTTAMVEMIDFYKTLSDLAGLGSPPAYVEGLSFRPVLQDPTARVRDCILTYLESFGEGHTLRTERYRFTSWSGGGPDRIELYDHVSDPAEMHNLAGDPGQAELIVQLEARLRQRVASALAAPQGLIVLPNTPPPRPSERKIATP